MPFRKLNIGCGGNKEYSFRNIGANVNLDISKPNIEIKNFIQGDAENLPFKENSFLESYSYQVIEHIENPIKFLKEMLRVTIYYMEIITPHRYSKYAKKDPSHKSFFSVTWFKKALKNYHPIIHVSRGWFSRPKNIIVEIYLK